MINATAIGNVGKIVKRKFEDSNKSVINFSVCCRNGKKNV